jgi:hypothetical protein
MVEYISFETAKLAKEKGFNVPCRRYYRGSDIIISECNFPINSNSSDDEYSQPTQELLARWLREIYGINVQIIFIYWITNKISQYTYKIFKDSEEITDSMPIFKTYKKAMEAGLQEALRLIK